MKKLIAELVALSLFVIASVSISQAVSYTPDFSDYSFHGKQSDIDAAANAFFNTHYGITLDNMYLYKDNRDPFDGIGIANGKLNQQYKSATGRITFTDTTNFVNIDYVSLQTTIFSAYDSFDHVLKTVSLGSGSGKTTLSGSIAYLTVAGIGGYSAISDLTYDYDGTTDGHNTDTDPKHNTDTNSQVPEPSTICLLGVGLAGLCFLQRKRRKQS
jgi:hypothetical protein